MDLRLESLLLEKSLNLSLRYLGYSVILMALFFGQLYLIGNFEIGNSFGLLMSPLGVTVSAIILVGIHTYHNDGILVSIAVAVIFIIGFALYGVISLNPPQPDYGLLTGVGGAKLYGVPIGIVSSTVAFALRRFSPSQSPVVSEKTLLYCRLLLSHSTVSRMVLRASSPGLRNIHRGVVTLGSTV